jgi:predicted lipoprotein with Yx(FWY)xxD motif
MRCMTVLKPLPLIATFVVAVAIAGCGSSGSGSSGGSGGGLYGGSGAQSVPTTAPAAASPAAIGLSQGHLVDAQGRTLYLFEADTTSKSTCSGACAQGWPPATTSGQPKASQGVTASLLGTTKRSDGSTQVTYHGHPVYRFAGDAKAGQSNGEGVNAFGAEWWEVSAAGEAVQG